MNAKELALLEEIFRPLALPYPRESKLLILSAVDTIEFQKRCQAQGLMLLGMNAFIHHPDGTIQPTLQYSTDYTHTDKLWIPPQERYKLALEHLSLAEVQHLYFESAFETRD